MLQWTAVLFYLRREGFCNAGIIIWNSGLSNCCLLNGKYNPKRVESLYLTYTKYLSSLLLVDFHDEIKDDEQCVRLFPSPPVFTHEPLSLRIIRTSFTHIAHRIDPPIPIPSSKPSLLSLACLLFSTAWKIPPCTCITKSFWSRRNLRAQCLGMNHRPSTIPIGHSSRTTTSPPASKITSWSLFPSNPRQRHRPSCPSLEKISPPIICSFKKKEKCFSRSCQRAKRESPASRMANLAFKTWLGSLQADGVLLIHGDWKAWKNVLPPTSRGMWERWKPTKRAALSHKHKLTQRFAPSLRTLVEKTLIFSFRPCNEPTIKILEYNHIFVRLIPG